MKLDRVGALWQERAEVLKLCHELDEDEWYAPSAAAGWRVKDVVAHLGSGCRAVATWESVRLLSSKDVERTNDRLVDKRRSWEPDRVVAEYETWSRRAARIAGLVSRTPLAGLSMPLAELGRFPVRLVLGGVATFDHHIHLRHDIAAALGRPLPPTDANRMAVVLEWAFAQLENQYRATPPRLDGPLAISLEGPGGGTWRIDPTGQVISGTSDGAVAVIMGIATEFPEWATGRARWDSREVSIGGDKNCAIQFLDTLNI